MRWPQREYYIGIDEVGRGPIAGPVALCACVVSRKHATYVKNRLSGIIDSKQLSANKREDFFRIINELQNGGYLYYRYVTARATTIDSRGISWCLRQLVKRSIKKTHLNIEQFHVFLDGGLKLEDPFSSETIIKGDIHNWLIATSSVIAKVLRDRTMCHYARKIPGYGFEQHKGYGTKKHYQNITQKGFSRIHRATWINI